MEDFLVLLTELKLIFNQINFDKVHIPEIENSTIISMKARFLSMLKTIYYIVTYNHQFYPLMKLTSFLIIDYISDHFEALKIIQGIEVN